MARGVLPPHGIHHGDPCRYLLGPPPVASLTRISGAPERQARRLTRSDGRARERQAGRLLPAPACVCVPLDAAVIPCDENHYDHDKS